VTGGDLLAERFEQHRPRLRAVAQRMLGSLAEADDAVQEAWLRLDRTDTGGVDNLGAWLTTVVGRICLDMLRSRASRREEPLDAHRIDVPATGTGVAGGTAVATGTAAGDGANPEEETLLADSVGLALLVVLDTLTPVERLAFVLHDLFAVSFDEIAPIVGRSPAAARQLASRARRRVRTGGGTPDPGEGGVERGDGGRVDADVSRRRDIVDAFLTAARGGDVTALLTLLDPDVVMRADHAAVQLGASGEARGSAVVARFFSGRAAGALPALIDGVVGAVVVVDGRTRIAMGFTIAGGRIVGIDAVAEPERLREMEVTILDG
jgi:RNA polymerase sigma-70 factor (ECF subfamily)